MHSSNWANLRFVETPGRIGVLSCTFSPGRIGVPACTLQARTIVGGALRRPCTGVDAYAPRMRSAAQANAYAPSLASSMLIFQFVISSAVFSFMSGPADLILNVVPSRW